MYAKSEPENTLSRDHGHKRVHGIKVQCAVTPNGLIASPFGPVSRRHDIGLLVDSGLLQELS